MKYVIAVLAMSFAACQKMDKKTLLTDGLSNQNNIALANFQSLTVDSSTTELVLYNENERPCDNSYLPDAPARAFKNDMNQIVLFAPNFKNRAMVGPNFTGLAHDCRIRFAAGNRPSADSLDDRSWLHAFHTKNGKDIFALISASFIPYRHGLPCGGGSGTTDCWINGIAAAYSDNSGDTFRYHGAVPKHIFMAPPQSYDNSISIQPSYVSVTNFVPWHDSLFAMVWRRNATGVASFNCLIAAPVNDTAHWSVLEDGGYGAMSSLNGSAGWTLQPFTPKPVTGLTRNVRGLVLHEPTQTFIAVYQDRVNNIPGFYYSTSKDLKTWSGRTMLYPGAARSTVTGGEDAYEYPAFLDENSSDRNFGTVDDNFHLFFTKFVYTGSAYKRLLVAVPVKITSN